MKNNVTKAQLDSLPPLVEHVPAVVFRLTHDGDDWRTLYVTENISMYGYSAEEFRENRKTWISLVHPDDRVLLSRTIADYEAHGVGEYRLHYRLLKKNGDTVPVTEYNTINRDADGNIICYDTVILATSQTDESQRLIDDHYRQQAVLNDILISLHDSDPKNALQIILDRTGAYLDTSRALLFKDSPDHRTCKIVYEWCNRGIPSVMDLDYSITYATEMPEIYVALQTSGSLLIDYGEIPENCREEFEAEGLIASAIFAVYLDGKHYGFVCFDDCIVQRRWDEETTRFLKNISNLISTVLARQSSTDQLMQSQRTYETVLNNIDSYIFVTTPEMDQIIFANEAFQQAFGDDCIGQPVGTCLHLPASIGEAGPSYGAQGHAIYPEMYCERTGEWLAVSSESMVWVDGRRVLLVNCYDTTAKKLYADAVERMAYLDHLTGLPNRYRCDVMLDEALALARETGKRGHLLFMDMDDFKIVNDCYGHDYGDGVLISFAEYLKAAICPPHQAFRFGGDEFVILLTPGHEGEVEPLLARLLQRATQPWHCQEKAFYCTLSIGVVEFSGAEESSHTVVKHADIAMYEAKRKGKNQYEYYEQRLDAPTLQRSRMEALLRDAMANGFEGFEIHYQPVVDVRSGHIAGAEALLRLVDGDTRILPSEFLPLANYLGFMVPIGEHVLRCAAAECRKVLDAGMDDFIMSVNLSSTQMNQPDINARIEAILDAAGVPYRNFAISIAESIAIEDPKRMMSVSSGLRQHGLRIVLDDFGSGNASFIHLRDLPVDIITVSQVFMDALDDDYSRKFIEMMIQLCHSMEKEVCLSGIETKGQLAYSRSVGADTLQGFYLYRAKGADALARVLGIALPAGE